jgi:hypothetical protein
MKRFPVAPYLTRNSGPRDAIVKSRKAEMKQANEAVSSSDIRNPLPVLA